VGHDPPSISTNPALDAVLAVPAPSEAPDGYVDLLGDEHPTGRGPGQRLMVTRALPAIYERLWRPLGARVLMGALVPDERRLARELLALSPGDRVLDVGCGPGNFTRDFALAAPDELVVGLDASRTMLAQAVREPTPGNVVYVRGDARALPFRDATFDAVACLAALYLIEEPMRAIDEIVRVLAPGGRVALLASSSRGPLPAWVADAVVRPLTGVRIFGPDALTGALRERGLVDVRRSVHGLGQFVAGRRG